MISASSCCRLCQDIFYERSTVCIIKCGLGGAGLRPAAERSSSTNWGYVSPPEFSAGFRHVSYPENGEAKRHAKWFRCRKRQSRLSAENKTKKSERVADMTYRGSSSGHNHSFCPTAGSGSWQLLVKRGAGRHYVTSSAALPVKTGASGARTAGSCGGVRLLFTPHAGGESILIGAS